MSPVSSMPAIFPSLIDPQFGANLAMQEMACMLEALLDFLPEEARLVEDGSDREQIGIMRRPLRLVVDFGSERRCG